MVVFFAEHFLSSLETEIDSGALRVVGDVVDCVGQVVVVVMVVETDANRRFVTANIRNKDILL